VNKPAAIYDRKFRFARKRFWNKAGGEISADISSYANKKYLNMNTWKNSATSETVLQFHIIREQSYSIEKTAVTSEYILVKNISLLSKILQLWPEDGTKI